MPIPLIAMGIGALASYMSSRNRGQQTQVDAENQARMLLYREQQFNPMAPYTRLARGQMYASLARAWGYDKLLGEDFLNHVSNAGSYPGTSAIGGQEYADPADVGFRRGGSTIGDVLSGAAGGYQAGRQAAGNEDNS